MEAYKARIERMKSVFEDAPWSHVKYDESKGEYEFDQKVPVSEAIREIDVNGKKASCLSLEDNFVFEVNNFKRKLCLKELWSNHLFVVSWTCDLSILIRYLLENWGICVFILF
jgi:hypothetical protein